MFLGKVVAFLRNISFFSLFKSSFIDVEPPFSVFEPTFNVFERRFNVYERRFKQAEKRNVPKKSNNFSWEHFLLYSNEMPTYSSV